MHGETVKQIFFWLFTQLNSLSHIWNITSSIQNGTDYTQYKNKLKYRNTDFYGIHFTSQSLHYTNCFIWCPVCLIHYFTNVLAVSILSALCNFIPVIQIWHLYYDDYDDDNS